MATGRERSHLPTPIFSRNSFNGCKSPKREAPLQYRAAATSLPPKQLTGRVHTQWDLPYENQSNLHSLTKATIKKQPSVRRLRHPSPPPPPGGDALLRLLLSAFAITAAKNAVPSPGHARSREGLLRPGVEGRARRAFKVKTAKIIKRIQIRIKRVHYF